MARLGIPSFVRTKFQALASPLLHYQPRSGRETLFVAEAQTVFTSVSFRFGANALCCKRGWQPSVPCRHAARLVPVLAPQLKHLSLSHFVFVCPSTCFFCLIPWLHRPDFSLFLRMAALFCVPLSPLAASHHSLGRAKSGWSSSGSPRARRPTPSTRTTRGRTSASRSTACENNGARSVPRSAPHERA